MVQVKVDKKKRSPNEKVEAPLFCWLLVSAESKGNICFKMFDRLTPPKQGDDSENVIPTCYISLTLNPSLQQLHWCFSNTKNLGVKSSRPRNSTLKLALASASFNLSAAKLSVTWAFISSPCSRSAMASKNKSRKWSRRFCEGFYGGKNGPKRSMYGIFSYLWSISMVKCRSTYTIHWVSGI